MYKIYYDAYCSPKRKNKAGYCVIVKKNNKTIQVEHGILNPNITCNQAELEALVKAIQISKLYGIFVFKLIHGDSLLSVNLFNGVFKTKIEKLAEILDRAWVESTGVVLGVKWISREINPAGKYIEKYIRK